MALLPLLKLPSGVAVDPFAIVAIGKKDVDEPGPLGGVSIYFDMISHTSYEVIRLGYEPCNLGLDYIDKNEFDAPMYAIIDFLLNVLREKINLIRECSYDVRQHIRELEKALSDVKSMISMQFATHSQVPFEKGS